MLIAATFVVATAVVGDPADADRGAASFRAGDYTGAAAALERARAADPGDLDLALLLGITYVRLGRDAEARPLLEAAARSPDRETAESAEVFLRRAPEDEVSAPPRLRGRVEALGGWDSNVPFQPEGRVKGPKPKKGAAGPGDGDLLATGRLSFRPLRRIDLRLDDELALRKHARLDEYDTLTNRAGARFAHDSDRLDLALRYRFEAGTLGGADHVRGNLVDARARVRASSGAGIEGSYALRDRDYRTATWAPFSGTTHTGVLAATWDSAGGAVDVALGYLVERDDVQDPALDATGHGARLDLLVDLGEHVDVGATGSYLHRSFDAAARGRHDDEIDGDLSLGIALGNTLELVVAGSVVRNLSTDASWDYLKVVGRAGLAATFSAL